MDTSATHSDNDTSRLPGMPPWAAGWAQLAIKFGATTLIAMYLVYSVAERFDMKLEAHATESRNAMVSMVLLLKQICHNTASTPEEKAACWSVR